MLTQVSGLPSGSIFPVGTINNTFVVSDNAGNTASCSFAVTVNDVEDPTVS
ncbi:MAG: HYR domain-containing protein, partial [Saprospiraceae bacterium]|nr:HYR domain-containing protein [Saprospiraceae bacterium]